MASDRADYLGFYPGTPVKGGRGLLPPASTVRQLPWGGRGRGGEGKKKIAGSPLTNSEIP